MQIPTPPPPVATPPLPPGPPPSGRRGFGGFAVQTPPVQVVSIPPPQVMTSIPAPASTIPVPPPPVSGFKKKYAVYYNRKFSIAVVICDGLADELNVLVAFFTCSTAVRATDLEKANKNTLILQSQKYNRR